MSATEQKGFVRHSISFKIFGIAVGLLLMMTVVTVFSSLNLHRVGLQLKLLSDYYIELDQRMGDMRAQTLREVIQIERVLHFRSAIQAGSEAEALALYKEAGNCEGPPMRAVYGKIRKAYPERAAQQLMAYRVARLCTDARLVVANQLVDAALLLPQVRNEPQQVARFTSIKAELVNIPLSRRKLNEYFEKYLTEIGNNDPGRLSVLQDQIDERRSEMNRRINAVSRELHAGTRDTSNNTEALEEKTQLLSWSVTLAACAFGLVVAFFITRNLVRPVRELLGLTQAIRSGNLDIHIEIKTGDEIGLLADSFNDMVEELRQKEQIKRMFGKYVDPRIVQGLLLDQKNFTEGGERRHMSVFFSDLQGFTTACEGLTPTGAVRMLNHYFSLMAQPIRDHRGIIDKYIGDSVMAFWGPPFSSATEHAAQACFAALEQQARIPEFQAMLPEVLGIRKNVPVIRVRMGIASGDVTIGSIGSEDVRSYTVIGDNVNLASRLEGANKYYGTQILISEETRCLAGDLIEVREIDAIRLVGKTESVRIYELLGRKDAADAAPKFKALREPYELGLQLFRDGQLNEADQAFDQCLQVCPTDGPAQLFKQRIAQRRAQSPDEPWDNVWTMSEK